MADEQTVPVETIPTPVVETIPTPIVETKVTPIKAKRDTNSELRQAAEIALNHYRKNHTMTALDDFNYPGFKELFC